MATFGHEQRQADAGLGEVGQGGVAQLVQRPALAVDLERGRLAAGVKDSLLLLENDPLP
jgi:hypothetical protein